MRRRLRGAGGPLAAALGAGVLVLCCALGPAVVLAGLGGALVGLGLGSWLALVGGLVVTLAGAVLVGRRRRSTRPQAGELAPPR